MATIGTLGDDTFFGTTENDVFLALAGADLLHGDGGDDILDGGTGNDTLSGGAGQDSLTGGAGADIFILENVGFAVSTAATDTISDFSIADGDRIDVSLLGISDFTTLQALLSGLGGDSFLSFRRNGFAQTVKLIGLADLAALTPAQFIFSSAAGNDSLTGSLNDDDLFGGLGDDALDGASGNDRLFGEAGRDRLAGGPGDDLLMGGSGDDTLTGGYGHDTLSGGDGDDVINGDYNSSALINESDSLSGGLGRDTLNGSGGNDSLDGGGDDDRLRGGLADDSLQGGAGADTFVIEDISAAAASVDSTDMIADFSAAEGDRIDVSLLGISEFATVRALLSGAGLSFLRGGYAQLTEFPGVDSLTLTAADFIFSTVMRNDAINGTDFADDLFGGLGNDSLEGFNDIDRLFGEGGNDRLSGGLSNDWLSGGSGHDTLDGGTGADTLTGGSGNDVFLIDDAGDVVIEAAGGGIDRVEASISYTLSYRLENLTLNGSANLRGTGNAFNNVLIGNDGNNLLVGGGGADTLQGGLGHDAMAGGTGLDVFVFEAIADSGPLFATGRDSITDFAAGTSLTAIDRIDLSRIDAQAGSAGFQTFTFIGTAAFSGEGQVQVTQSGANTLVQINTSGTAGAEMVIVLLNINATNLDSGDFIFF